MNADAMALIQRIIAEAHEAAADVMWTDHDKAKAHLAKAAVAIAAATKALERRRPHESDSVGGLRP